MKKTTFEYLDRVEFLDERYYNFINSKTKEIIPYISVTYSLKSFPMDYGLLQWFKDVGNQAELIANRAAESGSKVHSAISNLISGLTLKWTDEFGRAKYTEEEWQGINRFIEFWGIYKPKTLFNERIVFNHKYKYAGTIDYLCKIDDKIWLIDFKFSNAIHQSYMLQLAAYKKAIEEELDIKIDEVGILHLKAKSKQGWKLEQPKENIEFLFEVYLKVLDLFLFTNPNHKPKNLVYPNTLKL